MTKKWLIGLAIALVILGLVCGLGGRIASRFAPTPTPTSASTAAGERTVTARGVIVPARYVRLGFPTGGVLADLRVQEGDSVEAGQVLACLDTADLELGVRIAELRLAQLKAGPRPEDIAIAESNYQAALARYEKVKSGASQEEIAVAKANLEKARVALERAQAAYNLVAWDPGISARPESLALEQATIDYQLALAQYERAKAGPTPADLKAAWAEVASAKAQLERARTGASAEEIALAEAELERARLALEQAQLRAPFAGTVVSIGAREGEILSPGAVLITLADLSEMQVETTDLDEWGAARVKVGDPVQITVSAFKDKVLTGRVVAMDLEGVTNPAGDVIYTATIALDSQDPDLRWGMTVKVEFR
jgi:HlyD family secretion protein